MLRAVLEERLFLKVGNDNGKNCIFNAAWTDTF